MTTDLSKYLDHPTVTAIYDAYAKARANDKPRRYLGASIIGRECGRALWYDFRWATKVSFSGRLLRLFETGHLEEPRMVEDLRKIGCNVYDVNPTTGAQFAFDDLAGHFAGHMDGCAEHVPEGGKAWHVLEFKTHSEKSFNDLVKKGVREAKPEHYAQMMMYMGWSGMERALYLAKNKNTDELYAERIKFNRDEFELLRARAESIIFNQEPPLRLSTDPADWRCKRCDHHAVCFGDRVPQKSCRTCVHGTPTKAGNATWVCENSEREPIPFEHQLTGCGDHLHLPYLIQYAEPQIADPMFILYLHNETGRPFFVVTATGMPPVSLAKQYGENIPMYTSDEIAAAHKKFITNDDIDDIRKEFGGAITGVSQ